MIPVWLPIFEASSLKTKLVIDGGMNNYCCIICCGSSSWSWVMQQFQAEGQD
jgi:hypothetical protein